MSFYCFVGCLALTSTMSLNVMCRIRTLAMLTEILQMTWILTSGMGAVMITVALVIIGDSQSYDDFHDEQDNYDMMDDDF